MRLAFLLFFLTLVVVPARAAPDTSVRPAPVPLKEKTEEIPAKKFEMDSLQTTEPLPVSPEARTQRKVSDGSTNFGLGTANGKLDEDKEDLSLPVFAIQRTQYNLDESAQEFGLSLLPKVSESLIGVDWGFKKFCCFTNFAASYDPFYKIGVAGLYDPEDQLGNLIDYKKYFAQVSVGFESFFESRKLWHFELGGRAGYPGAHIFATLYYALPD
ncbi:MAG: hypothetical protein ACAH59_06015 [Pseudobdellovibrionaceae bacterium]